MSNTNDINFKSTGNDIDDAEGHAIRAGKLENGSGTDAEGHGVTSKHFDDGSDIDAEGHVAKAGRSATTGTGAGKPRIKP